MQLCAGVLDLLDLLHLLNRPLLVSELKEGNLTGAYDDGDFHAF